MPALRLTAIDVALDVTLVGSRADAVFARASSTWSGLARSGDERAEETLEFDTSAGVDEALSRLTQQITLHAINARMGTHLMIHAGAVELGDGRAAMFIGRSGAGKTTMMRTLGEHYGYLSDETVALRADGTVIPYPKPLSLVREGTWVKDQPAPSELGLLPWSGDELRVARIGLLERSPDFLGDVPEIEPVDTLEAITVIAPQVSGLRFLSEPLARLAGVIDGAGGAVRIRYRDAADVLPLVSGWTAS